MPTLHDHDCTEHAGHVHRHLDRLRQVYAQPKIDAILARCPYAGTGTRIGIGDDQCRGYLEAVLDCVGKTAYHFAAANFIFAGCKVAEELRSRL